MKKLVVENKKDFDLPIVYLDYDGKETRTKFLVGKTEFIEPMASLIKESGTYKSYMKSKWISEVKESSKKVDKSKNKVKTTIEKE